MSTRFEIKHQQQPTWWSCNQTVLAMLIDVPVGDVIRVFPSEGMQQRELYAALDRCGFTWNQFVFGTLVVEGLYILAVPSLNLEAGGHSILLDWRGPSSPSFVFDPNRGKPGKRFYSATKEAESVPLGWWSEMILVLPGGGLPL